MSFRSSKCGDPRNIMCVIMDVNNGFYKLGTKNGVLDRLYCRNELLICDQQFFDIDEVPSATEFSLRQAVGAASVSGKTQGFIRCNCTAGKCKTNSCKCKKAKILCNSRCHNSTSCCNKQACIAHEFFLTHDIYD